MDYHMIEFQNVSKSFWTCSSRNVITNNASSKIEIEQFSTLESSFTETRLEQAEANALLRQTMLAQSVQTMEAKQNIWHLMSAP